MRYLRYLILAIIATGLIFVALANHDTVTLTLMPAVFGDFLGFNFAIDMPLFVVIFGGVGVGLIIGFVWEWVREMKHRSAVKSEHKQVVRLERELGRLKADKSDDQDDVLALLDETR